MIENITDTVSETLDAPKQSVRVLVTEMPKTHWGIAGVPASEIENNIMVNKNTCMFCCEFITLFMSLSHAYRYFFVISSYQRKSLHFDS